MRYRDYHLHSEFSFDSTEQIENICKKAIEENISEIVLTDHMEFQTENIDKWPDFELRDQALERCRKLYGKFLSIRSGVEVGQPQRDLTKEKRALEKHNFDFVIASIHKVGNIGTLSSISFTEENYTEYIRKYLEESKEMARQCDYDVIGHVTFPFRYVPESLLKKYPIESFKDEYLELFTLIAERGKGIEVNTSGLRTCLHATMPSVQLVRWFKECGGKNITVGSDGHSIRSAFSGLETGYQVLIRAGFQCVAVYREREISYMDI